MKIETFLVITDSIIFELGRRMEIYTEINNRFRFLLNLGNETLDDILIKDKNLVALYNLDIEIDFVELVQLLN